MDYSYNIDHIAMLFFNNTVYSDVCAWNSGYVFIVLDHYMRISIEGYLQFFLFTGKFDFSSGEKIALTYD